MSAPLLEFECRPAVGGYRVVTFDPAKGTRLDAADKFGPISLTPDATDDERYLAERWGGLLLSDEPQPSVWHLLRPRSQRTRRFDLYQAGRSAFLDFAQTPRTPDGVEAFAARYGPLRSHGDYLGAKVEFFFGHALGTWYGEIFEMSEAVALWDKGPSKPYVSKLVRLLGRQDIPLLWYKGGDKAFNKRVRLLKREDPHFIGGPREAPGTTAKILLKRDPQTTQPRVCIRPTHLLDALWIQLALAIDGSESLRTCVECKKWFTIKAGEGRSDKEYCSDACRMRAYRKRKERRGRAGRQS
jgi:hypothetical protein